MHTNQGSILVMHSTTHTYAVSWSYDLRELAANMDILSDIIDV
jgi:hypothetical protein